MLGNVRDIPVGFREGDDAVGADGPAGGFFDSIIEFREVGNRREEGYPFGLVNPFVGRFQRNTPDLCA